MNYSMICNGVQVELTELRESTFKTLQFMHDKRRRAIKWNPLLVQQC